VISHGSLAGDDHRALRLPVAVAEPAMILPAGIDHIDHRLIGDAAHRVMQPLGALVGPARIHQHRALGRDDKTEGGVVGQIGRAALRGLADDGPNIVRDRLNLQHLRLRKRGHRHQHGCNSGADHGVIQASSFAASGKPPA
jgi:hypothetical protein